MIMSNLNLNQAKVGSRLPSPFVSQTQTPKEACSPVRSRVASRPSSPFLQTAESHRAVIKGIGLEIFTSKKL